MRILKLIILLFFFTNLLYVSPLLKAEESDDSTFYIGQIGNTTLDRSLSNSGSTIELLAGDNSTIKLKFGKESQTKNNKLATEGIDTISKNSWNFVISSPLNQNNKKTAQVATLDGLADSFKVSVNYNSFNSRLFGDTNAKELVSLRDENLCTKTWNAFKNDSNQNTAKYKDSKEFCNATEFGSYLLNYYPDDYDKYQSKIYPSPKLSNINTWDYMYSFSTAVGYNSYDYYNNSTLEKDDVDKFPWSVGGSLGFIVSSDKNKFNGIIIFGYEYQESYKENDESTMCPASVGSSLVECTTGSFGEPVKQYKNLSSIEIRGLFDVPILSDKYNDVGFSLKFTHDFTSHDNGVDLPIYLFRNEDNSLNGGIRFGYIDDDDDDEFTAGIFVGTSLNIFD